MAPRTLTSAGWPRPSEPPPPQHDPSVFLLQPLLRAGEKLRLLPRCRFFPPLRACRHNVFNSQYRIFTAFFRQQLPQLSHRLICRLRHRAVVFWCPFSVSIRRLTLPVAVLQKRWPHCPFPSAFCSALSRNSPCLPPRSGVHPASRGIALRCLRRATIRMIVYSLDFATQNRSLNST